MLPSVEDRNYTPGYQQQNSASHVGKKDKAEKSRSSESHSHDI